MNAGEGFRRYTGGWVTLPNETVNDTRLSYRARGVLQYLLGRPPGWSFAADRIARQSPTEGREAVLTALRELETHGYVRRRRIRNAEGQVATITEAAATPDLMPPETGEPTPAEPAPAEPESARPTPQSLTEEATTEEARTDERRGAVQTAPTDRARVDGPTPRPLSPQARETLRVREERQAARARGVAAASRRAQEHA